MDKAAQLQQFFIENKGWVVNFLFFQLAWLVCVALNQSGLFLLMLPLLALHFGFSAHIRKDIRTGLIFMLVGAVGEAFLLAQNAFSVKDQFESFPPYWLLTLWFCFGLSTLHSMNWLRFENTNNAFARTVMQAACSGLFAPFAYLAAAKLDAISLGTNGLIMIGVGWAIMVPVAITLSSHAKMEVN